MTQLLLLTRADITGLLSLDDHLTAVETAFRLLGEGHADLPPPMHVSGTDGMFHVKAAALPLNRRYAAFKVNGNFPANPARYGLPTIQGAILLFDGDLGRPVAVMDSIEITIARTGAASGLAARYLARPDSRVATVCGCGEQGRIQLANMAHVLPITRAYVWDIDSDRAADFAARMTQDLGFDVIVATDLRTATLQSDVIVTCTTARKAYVGCDDVRPGCFIAAVGADNPDKQELQPMLLAAAHVFADVADQCAAMGDLHHAIAAGVMTRSDVAGELADLVTGRDPGRTSADQITVFDSTGTAVQDVAAAALAYERALERGAGLAVDFA